MLASVITTSRVLYLHHSSSTCPLVCYVAFLLRNGVCSGLWSWELLILERTSPWHCLWCQLQYAFATKFTGFSICHPVYDDTRMLKCVQHSLRSAMCSELPTATWSRILWCIWTSRKDGHLACFAEHAVSISTFLDTQEFFQEAKMKDVCTGGYWGIICQWKSGPYLTSVQASCQSEDLEKPQHGMFSVCDTLARTGSVNSSYREPGQHNVAAQDSTRTSGTSARDVISIALL